MFYQELRKNISYPEEAKRLGTEGVVNLKFTVDRYGDVENLQAIANFDAPDYVKNEMISEAKRAFKNCEQNWEPAEINNFSVAEWVILPVNFQLEPAGTLDRVM
jgi:protein TonB